MSLTVPVTLSPPTTVVALNETDATAIEGPTVRAGDCRLLPFIDAVIVAVPGVTPVTRKAAFVAPAKGVEAQRDVRLLGVVGMQADPRRLLKA